MKASLKILDEYGLLPLQTFRIPSNSQPGTMYTVEQMHEGYRCDCVAGLMRRECSHIKKVKNTHEQ